jgi:hypothetical protein
VACRIAGEVGLRLYDPRAEPRSVQVVHERLADKEPRELGSVEGKVAAGERRDFREDG